MRFSQDCRASMARHSYECHKKFCIVNSRKFRGKNLAVTCSRHSRDSLAKYFGEIIRIKFFNMLKNFVTSSRLVRDTRKFSRQSCEIFWRNNSHKIFQHVEKLCDQFATSSRHKKILTTLARHSHECHAKVRDKICKTVARIACQ